jgi:phenylacetate-coenzyme A ligase PaaK-like adenylate-forming protein
MIWYYGYNLFPSAVEAVVRGIPELGNEYQLVITGPADMPIVTLRTEARQRAAPGLAAAVSAALQAAIGEAIAVELLPLGTLLVSVPGGKPRRVLDLRDR